MNHDAPVRVVCFGDIGLTETANNTRVVEPKTRGKWSSTSLSPWAKALDIIKENERKKEREMGKVPQEKVVTFELANEPAIIKQSFENYIDQYNSTRFSITKICCQYDHTLLLTSDGTLYSFGSGLFGKLGNGETSSEVTPFKVLDSVSDMATGLNHSVAICTDGRVYSWGTSCYGQLGHGSLDDEYEPKLVRYFSLNNIKATRVACGENHTIVLTDSGLIFGFGRATEGQLGILSHLKNRKDVDGEIEVVEEDNDTITHDAQLLYQWVPKIMKAFEPVPYKKRMQIKGLPRRVFVKFVQIDCGQNYSAALSENGAMYLCGEGRCGALCQGTIEIANYKPVLAQFEVSPPVEHRIIDVRVLLTGEEPFQASTKFTLAFETEQPPPPQIRLSQIACGWNHVLCLGDDKRVYAAGLNLNGQCGQNHKNKVLKLSAVHLPKQLREQGVASITCGDTFSIITSCKTI